MEVDDFLEHFGVMGMKWGVRKSKKQTGISRSRAALIERNNNSMKFLTGAREGTHHRRTVALGRKMISPERWERNYQMTMKNLTAQNKRLSEGKLIVQDRMDIAFQISLLDLIRTKTPTRPGAMY